MFVFCVLSLQVARKDREVLLEQRRAEFKNAKLLAVRCCGTLRA